MSFDRINVLDCRLSGVITVLFISYGLVLLLFFVLADFIREQKGALAWYGKLTWESAHAWILIILCNLLSGV